MQAPRRWLVIALFIAVAAGLLAAASLLDDHSIRYRREARAAAHRCAAGEPPGAVPQPAAHPNGVGPAVREVTVCGLGTVRYEDDGKSTPAAAIDRATASARNRWQQSLIDSKDTHIHAAGLLLQSHERKTPPGGSPKPTTQANAAREQLLEAAASGDDVQINAMAVRACDDARLNRAPDPLCIRVPLAKWVTLDPDNAAPWLELAAAYAWSDPKAASAAVDHAAQAHQLDFYNDSLLTAALSGMPPETTELEQAVFLAGLIGHNSADSSDRGSLSFATNYCRYALSAASLLKPCEALAELFAQHAHNMLELAVAAHLGAEVGWPGPRINAIHQENAAIIRFQLGGLLPSWSCAAVRALNTFARLQGQSGELGAVREETSHSAQSSSAAGESTPEPH